MTWSLQRSSSKNFPIVAWLWKDHYVNRRMNVIHKISLRLCIENANLPIIQEQVLNYKTV